MAISISDLFTSFTSWLSSIQDSNITIAARKWCLMGFNQAINQENIRAFFDRSKLNEDYIKKYSTRNLADQKAYSHIQLEINAIYSLHKSFASRHKTRLQYYTNDFSQKTTRTKAALNIVGGKITAFKTKLSK